jgi:hypothetical protein
MWAKILSSAASIGSGIYLYLIVAGASGAIVGYGAYSWTSDYYIAKIEKSNIEAEQKVNDIQRKGDQLVADYIKQIEQLASSNASLQRQVSMAVVHSNGSSCVVSDGFVRLYNASTTGEASSPSRTDGASSGVDEATLLSVAIENNTKYLKIADQLTKLQAYENAK